MRISFVAIPKSQKFRFVHMQNTRTMSIDPLYHTRLTRLLELTLRPCYTGTWHPRGCQYYPTACLRTCHMAPWRHPEPYAPQAYVSARRVLFLAQPMHADWPFVVARAIYRRCDTRSALARNTTYSLSIFRTQHYSPSVMLRGGARLTFARMSHVTPALHLRRYGGV
jgi:hypothetical protein